MRPILIILFFLQIIVSVKSQAQKWMPGHFTTVNDSIGTGFIRIDPSGKGIIKDEGFIEFKTDKKAKSFKISAGNIKSFVIGRDSFIVAHAPKNETWRGKELDFVEVVLDDDIKIYAGYGGNSGSSGNGFSVGIGLGGGFGIPIGRNFGMGIGGGLEVPLFGNGNDEGLAWYYGEDTAHLFRFTEENFEDITSNIMGDEPDIVEKIHSKFYNLSNINKLIADFKKLRHSEVGG